MKTAKTVNSQYCNYIGNAQASNVGLPVGFIWTKLTAFVFVLLDTIVL